MINSQLKPIRHIPFPSPASAPSKQAPASLYNTFTPQNKSSKNIIGKLLPIVWIYVESFRSIFSVKQAS